MIETKSNYNLESCRAALSSAAANYMSKELYIEPRRKSLSLLALTAELIEILKEKFI
jgi:hypothetical protein